MEREHRLPRIEDLPLAEQGYDPATVEDAFARFEGRLTELETRLEVLDEVRDELRRLRSSPARGLETTYAEEEWPADAVAPLGPEPVWVSSVRPPLVGPSALPRILVEAGFLLAVALLSALASLSPLLIAGVMAAAWALVALNEWVAAERRARWLAEPLRTPTPGEDTEESSPWDVPPVEATVVVPPDDSESRTIIARLPETPAPARRKRFLRRRAERPDPWEAEPE